MSNLQDSLVLGKKNQWVFEEEEWEGEGQTQLWPRTSGLFSTLGVTADGFESADEYEPGSEHPDEACLAGLAQVPKGTMATWTANTWKV